MTPLSLPPEDREASPYTGWVRAHWDALVDHLLAGAAPYAIEGGALYALPGGRPSSSGAHFDAFEGYSRTFLLAAVRLAGAEGAAPGELAGRYASGLVAGLSAATPGSGWPDLRATPDAHIEAASIAISLYETQPWIWAHLSDRERERLLGWLAGGRGHRYPRNNWSWFPVIVNTFLKRMGASYSQADIDAHLERIDALYRSGGWYSDGHGRHFDYYNSWGFHYYAAMWCRMGGDEDDATRAAVFRERLSAFLEDFRFFFGAEGAPVFQGRSLIYRCAATAAVAAGALLGCSPLAAGETRRITSGALRYVSERCITPDGRLAMGWHDEFLPMTQAYSGPASPYWASKGFLALLAPSTDPLWTAKEAPLAVEQGDFVRAVPTPNWLLYGTRADGVVRMANHGSDHYPFFEDEGRSNVHYRKLGYSTHSGPDTGRTDDIDSHTALVSPEGKASARSRIYPLGTYDRYVASHYFPRERAEKRQQAPGMWNERIETASVVHGAFELRLHGASTLYERRLRDGGWAIASDEQIETSCGDGWAMARRPDGLTSIIAGVWGYESAAVHCAEGANAFGRYSATPYLLSGEMGPERVLASICVLTYEEIGADDVMCQIVRFDVAGRVATVVWADGETVAVQMVAVDDVTIPVDGEPLRGRIRYARIASDGTRFVLTE